VFGVFFAGAFFCLFVSAFFHLVSNHSYEVALIWNRCDYAGITFMIVGSSFPLIYFAFNCHPHLQVAALAFITVLGLVSLPVVLMERFAKPKCAGGELRGSDRSKLAAKRAGLTQGTCASEWFLRRVHTRYRPIRSMLYVGLGCSGIAPMMYLAFEVGWAHVYNATALHWTLTMGALYLVGVTLYALRVPERHFPGKFDYFLHSHQVRARLSEPTTSVCCQHANRPCGRPAKSAEPRAARSSIFACCLPRSCTGLACSRPTSGTCPRRASRRTCNTSKHLHNNCSTVIDKLFSTCILIIYSVQRSILICRMG
jgi:predicted membrane channel-forming protein YqfA (hemolysin III family)